MRTPKYISPSSFKMFRDDRQQYYRQKLADNARPGIDQTQAMSIGSAFDAFVKSDLHYKIYGNYGKVVTTESRNGEIIVGEEYEAERLVKVQVEEANRDWAREHGRKLFTLYKQSGALAALMAELEQASSAPQFEITVEGVVQRSAEIAGIPLSGKPDICFRSKSGLVIILDWKVNGYCSKSPKSPMPGYVRIVDGWTGERSHTRSHNTKYEKGLFEWVEGIEISRSHLIEDLDMDWANQQTIYAWLLGCPIGAEFIMGIEQLCGTGTQPYCRIASHRSRVTPLFQDKLYSELADMWERLQKGPRYIFDPQGDESEQLCASLETDSLIPKEESYLYDR